jgi:hypothetical protein
MSQQLPEAATALLETPLTVEQRIATMPVPDWHREELERRLEKANAEI